MATDTRDRILVTTAELFRRQGYNGTGIKQIVAAAGAPFGSVYHHFPGGKEQLGAEVVRTAGTFYAQIIPLVFDDAGDLAAAVRDGFALAGVHLEQSGWEDACPIATVALEVASVNEPLREATADVFDGWIATGTRYFTARGMAADAAREITIAFVCALEGAFVLARSLRSVEPLHAAGEAVAAHMARLLAR